MDIETMEAGRCLDAWIAEKVMGWEKFNVEYYGTDECSERQYVLRDWMKEVELDSVGTYFIDVDSDFWKETRDWKPSTDIAAAWEVVEKLLASEKWETFDLQWFHERSECQPKRPLQPWWAIFIPFEPEGGEFDDWWWASAAGETAQIAICRAALKAVDAN